MRSTNRILIALAIALTLLAPVGNCQRKQDNVTPEVVQRAIKNGLVFLVNSQRDGRWSGSFEIRGSGSTALIVLSMLNCGVSPDDPALKKSMEYLRKTSPTNTYECALQTMVYCTAEPRRDRKLIERNVSWLLKAESSGADLGGWSYLNPGSGSDESNSQFALLALWEAQRVGVEVPRKVLMEARDYWIRMQSRDGGWGYQRTPSTGSMTCAGIASLLIAEDALDTVDVKIDASGIHCCGASDQLSEIDRGVNWLANNFQIQGNPGAGSWHLYYMYALERVGRLSGQRLIGGHDWYREGCAELVRLQDGTSGFFNSRTGNETDRVVNTALALLFLSKGKRQIVYGRVDYRSNDNKQGLSWNTHRRSIQNLTGHIEQAWKKDLAWQTVNLRTAELPDLLECPVLYINGTEKLNFDKRQKELLKAYVQQGGFIFAEACDGNDCRGEEFDKSFRDLVEEVFEQPLRKLPIDHPIWNADARVSPQALPEGFWLYGLEQCCRTSIVYSPISLSCRWELHRPIGKLPELKDVQRLDIENATKIGINVASYATNRELKEKLDQVQILEPIADRTPAARGTIVLPKLQHTGGADDVPQAIPNLLEFMKRNAPTNISSKAIMVSPVDQELEKYPLLYIHGRKKFSYTAEQRAALRRFFDNGGFLLGDAICASGEFAESLRNELAAILPEGTLKNVPADHPMLTPQFNGFDIRRVKMMDPVVSNDKSVQLQKREGAPSLEMLIYKERVVAVFSKYDISCALESRGSTQCRGYPTQDAARIGINMILFAMLQE